jgi:signal transduction histidine kinase/ligand-binding sensor domain-containing protein
MGMPHLRKKNYIGPCLFWIFGLFTSHALALAPEASINDYSHQIWGRKEGAPPDISVMAQTDDGWLWIGTNYGLYRFDGLQFERYQSPSGKQLAGTRVTILSGAPGNKLLIGYMDGGIDIIHNGEVVNLPSLRIPDKSVVNALAPDFDGSAWVGTSTGLFHYGEGHVRKIAGDWGVPDKVIEYIILDPYGQIWIKSENEWYKLDRKNKRFVPTGSIGESNMIFAPDGSMWWQKGEQLIRVTNSHDESSIAKWEWQRYYTPDGPFMFDDVGNLWTLDSPKGIARIRRKDLPKTDILNPRLLNAERFTKAGEISHRHVDMSLKDREGNIWVLSREGLERFRNQLIRNIPMPEGILSGSSHITADGQGRIWAGADNLKDLWDIAYDPPPPFKRYHTILPAVGRDGALLRSGPTGIERYLAGKRINSIPLPSQCASSVPRDVILMAEDNSSLWVIIRRCDSFRYKEGGWQNFKSLGVSERTRAMAPDHEGGMWFGNVYGQVQRHFDGKTTNYSLSDGGTLGPIRFIDAKQEVIVSGETGSAVMRGGRFWRLSATVPDALKTLVGMVILPNGDHWLHTSLGMAKIRAADWKATMQYLSIPLRMDLLDSADGYGGSPSLMTMLPNGTLDAQGKIWFATTSGIGVLDPSRDYRNPIPPTVLVNSVTDGQQSYPPGAAIVLRPRPARVDVNFSAVSLSMPERMQVWYKLDGVDESWQLAGTRRSASYPKLNPGNYHFSMKAVTRDGVWSEHDATVNFTVQPDFSQTIWFHLMCAALVVGIGYLIYRLRMRQVVRRMNALLSERLLERERIARALHDSWIQNVHGLVLSVDGVSKSLPEKTPARERLEEVLVHADNVLADGRNAVMGLRAAAISADDIEQVFTNLGNRLQREHGAVFSLRRSGRQRPLDRAAWEDLFFVGHEALVNAYQHADARQVSLALEYGANQFKLSIRDDGVGLPEQVLRDGGKEGRWGLIGMRERAQVQHGEIQIVSQPGGGTEIQLSVPGVRAYAAELKPKMLERIRNCLSRSSILRSESK